MGFVKMYTYPAVTNHTLSGHVSRDDLSVSVWSIETEAGRQSVHEQLNRILASPAFRGSKRLSAFLSFIVLQTVENPAGNLKERTVGVHVFGRPADYDTSLEPVVRVSAGDLRKRIAQYYHEPGHEGELRIDLPAGAYRPTFSISTTASVEREAARVEVPVPIRENIPKPTIEPAIPPARDRFASFRLHRVAYAVGIATIALLGTVAILASTMPGSAYEQFWGPVVDAEGPVVVYAGTAQDGRLEFDDALALAHLSLGLHSQKKPYRILRESELTPEVMKQGPSLLVGGFDSPVVRRLTQQLRFTFATEGSSASAMISYIQDRQNPARRDWSVTASPADVSATQTDYAIVSRVIDPVTDRIAVVSAGIGCHGNLAAAEFLSHPEQFDAVRAKAPRDWRKKNMQAVLAVQVKNGVAGAGRVVASYFW